MGELIINESINDICIYTKWILIFVNLYLVFYKHDNNGTGYISLMLYVLLFCVFYIPQNGDVIGYFNLYKTGNVSGHLEPFYEWTINAIPQGFFYWRSVIWGLAMFFIILTFKKLNIEAGYATISFLSFSLLQNFYYLRNDLAFSILFFSIVHIIYLRYNHISKYLIILYMIIALSSYFLHKSMPLYLVLSAIALYFIFKKKNFYILILIFPVIFFSYKWIATTFLEYNIWINSEDTVNYVMDTMNSDGNLWSKSSVLGKLNLLLTFLPSIYLFIKVPEILRYKDTLEEQYMLYFLIMTFLIAIISFICLFQISEKLHFRFWLTSLFPFTFFISLYVKKYHKRNETKTFYVLVVLNWISTFIQTFL